MELEAGVSGIAHDHDLWVEAVDLEEIAGLYLMKTVQVPPVMTLPWFHQIPSLVDLSNSYHNTIGMTLW